MRQALAIALAVAVLALLYSRIDLSALGRTLAGTDALWLGLALALMAPMLVLLAWRLRSLVPRERPLPLGEGLRLILAATTLNSALPSHLGDLAKAYFLAERGRVGGSLAFSLVVFERFCDFFALFAWCLLGLVALPVAGGLRLPLALAAGLGTAACLLLVLRPSLAEPLLRAVVTLAPRRLASRVDSLLAAWQELGRYLRENRRVVARVVCLSLGVWFLHALQIWFFALALGASVPFFANLALAPLVIFIGLLPITFAGIGTRDTAIVFFYAPFLSLEEGAALGILALLRYVVPGLMGLPLLTRYVGALRNS